MQDDDYQAMYGGGGGGIDRGPALAAYILCVGAILILVGVSISFQGSLQF